jgi:hypothetical protein
MPIPFDQIYRDASDSRISWQEALEETLIIDDDGEVLLPGNEKQVNDLHNKFASLRHYSITAEDNLLDEVLNRLENTFSYSFSNRKKSL